MLAELYVNNFKCTLATVSTVRKTEEKELSDSQLTSGKHHCEDVSGEILLPSEELLATVVKIRFPM